MQPDARALASAGRLVGAVTLMAHPWFARIDWHMHAHSAGQNLSRLGSESFTPQSLQSLAAADGTFGLHAAASDHTGQHSRLAAQGGSTPPPLLRERTGSYGSKSLGGVEGDAARSVHSIGMESERSTASTNLADIVAEGSETTAHLDNLMGLNERGILCADEQHNVLGCDIGQHSQ